MTLAYGDGGAPRVVEKDSPEYPAAQLACQALRPSRSPVQAGPQELAAAQRTSDCMRAEGITWYPDPDPVTGEVKQTAGGTPEQWGSLKRDHMETLLKCMPRP